MWRFRHPRHRIHAGQSLRFLLMAPAVIHWRMEGQEDRRVCVTEDWGLGHVASLATAGMQPGDRLAFTLDLPGHDVSDGREFYVEVVA